jgi:hypothetical protein
LVLTEVRRSERIKSNDQGLKEKTCQDKSCFCCNIELPTLSTKFIRNMGKDFCKIPGKLMSDEELRKKAKTKKKLQDLVSRCHRSR